MAVIEETGPIVQKGICPSCGAETDFHLLGIQRWPEQVAKKSGAPLEETIWQCCNCETTLTESSLKQLFPTRSS